MKKILYFTFAFFVILTACSNKTSKELLDSADAKAKNGDYKGAIVDYDKAIEQEPGNIQAIFHRGNTKTCVSDFKGAMEDYSMVLKLDPKDGNAFSCRGNCKKITGDYPGAIAEFDNALLFKVHDSAKAYQLRGFCKMKTNDILGAIADLDKAIELNAQLPDAYLYRGQVKLINGANSEACADFSKASSLGQKEADELISKNCK